MGPCSVCFGTIKGGSNTNIVADKCSIAIDMRLSPPLTNEASFKLVEDAIEAGCARVPGSKGSYRIIAYRPFVAQDENSVLFQAIKKSVKKIAGKEAKLTFFAGYTDSGVIAGSTGSGNCMSYGTMGGRFHQPDEYVECASLVETTEVVCDLARRLLLDEE
ncbi:Acetylornithine deacetylase [bioreactor metagenome]|uniref:Acetylornithine deacetylase n=1 Tax=bioreactor metagenome TaxID=1076179 RepID=A0A645GJJ3_9ZZZZ